MPGGRYLYAVLVPFAMAGWTDYDDFCLSQELHILPAEQDIDEGPGENPFGCVDVSELLGAESSGTGDLPNRHNLPLFCRALEESCFLQASTPQNPTATRPVATPCRAPTPPPPLVDSSDSEEDAVQEEAGAPSASSRSRPSSSQAPPQACTE